MYTYLVQCEVPCGSNDQFLVKANNKKEALDKVWTEYYIPINEAIDRNGGYEPYYKKDLCIRNIEKEILKNSNFEMI